MKVVCSSWQKWKWPWLWLPSVLWSWQILISVLSIFWGSSHLSSLLQIWLHSPPVLQSVRPSFLSSSTNLVLSLLPVHDSNLYPDSTTTNHMSHDYSNLTIHPSEYSGEEKVRVGDGSALPIHHTGSSSFSTPSGKLLLHNLLHVPLILYVSFVLITLFSLNFTLIVFVSRLFAP